MIKFIAPLLVVMLVTLTSLEVYKSEKLIVEEPIILSYEVNPQRQNLHFYWKDVRGVNYGNFFKLKTDLEQQHEKLIFAMNGGMYLRDQSPQGLYIENGKIKAPIDLQSAGYGNFYLQPNGVFYVTNNNQPIICTTASFVYSKHIKYATQSGPMLLIEGNVHPKLNKGSVNVHIRNGVGILPSGNLIFAMSKQEINFYDFATFFKKKGCQNALYLDGFVSRTYLPSKKWEQYDGNFGVIIGVVE